MFRILSVIKTGIVFLICLWLFQFADTYALSIRPPVLNSISNPENYRQEVEYVIVIMAEERSILEELECYIQDAQDYLKGCSFYTEFEFRSLVEVQAWLKKSRGFLKNQDVIIEISVDGEKFSNLEDFVNWIRNTPIYFTTMIDIKRRDKDSAI